MSDEGKDREVVSESGTTALVPENEVDPAEANPAVVQEPEDPKPVEYRIPDTCSQRVLGHEPGEKFTAALPPEQEARLIARGQLERTGGNRSTTP